MPIQVPAADGHVLAAPLAALLPVRHAGSSDPDRSLAAWVLYLEVLLRGAERAVGGNAEVREQAQRELVWFLRSTPREAVELDHHANLAIAALDDEDTVAALARLQACRDSMAALPCGVDAATAAGAGGPRYEQ
jgi:hypothetical protein